MPSEPRQLLLYALFVLIVVASPEECQESEEFFALVAQEPMRNAESSERMCKSDELLLMLLVMPASFAFRTPPSRRSSGQAPKNVNGYIIEEKQVNDWGRIAIAGREFVARNTSRLIDGLPAGETLIRTN